MNPKNRLLSPCGRFQPDTDRVAVDIDAFVRRFLLFDTFILDSTRLLEVPDLVNAFKGSGLVTLFSSESLKVHCDAVSVGQVGQLAVSERRRHKGLLPFSSYDLQPVRIADRDAYLDQCFQSVETLPGLSKQRRNAVQEAIRHSLIVADPTIGAGAVKAALSDLDNAELLKMMAVRAIAKLLKIDVVSDHVDVRAYRLDGEDFRLESNLGSLLGLNEVQLHRVLEETALGLGGLNLRIEEMASYNAVSGVLGDEASILKQKASFLVRGIAPQATEMQYLRIIEITGLPRIAPGSSIDAEALLKIRESDECKEFRQWIGSLQEFSDEEIRQRVNGMTARISAAAHSLPGKAVRLLVPTAVGLLPDIGVLAGLALGAVDMFVLDQLLAKPGPAAFLSRYYPSILRKV